jgi:hypothetical protein
VPDRLINDRILADALGQLETFHINLNRVGGQMALSPGRVRSRAREP